MFHIENTDSLSFKALASLMSNFISLICFTYGKELYDRKIYSDAKKYQSSLTLYEKLIKDIIPVSVIIYDNDQIYFTNKETQRVLRLNDHENNPKKLDEILIKDVIISDIEAAGEKETFIAERKQPEYNTLLTLMLDEKLSNNIIYCSPLLPKSEEKLSYDPLPIRLKMSQIFWDGSLANIVLFTEDHSALELKHLQQREVYKDRFLATISHELRNPLNGIIGMISNVIDDIKDEKIKNW